MDSLTQLTLGAVVGEAVAGKKLGNKALLWGGLAGTIPDLDVISNLWMNDIEAMSFHRGISHSIFFSFFVPLLFAWIAHRFYKSNIHQNKSYRAFWKFFWIIMGGVLLIGSIYLLTTAINIATVSAAIIFGGLGIYWIWRSARNISDSFENITYKQWYLFFFLGFATHIMIDAFTTYGTQIFQPFSDYRFTTSSISVVDPLYTIPMLLCLIAVVVCKRKNKIRSRWNWIGIGLSSLYMIFTFANKVNVHKKFENRLQELNVQSSNFMTNPTIFNNILWHGIAETDTAYIESYYSLLDKKQPFQDIKIVPKNRAIVKASGCDSSETIKTLRWFSDDFYNYSIVDGKTYYNDLRFGSIWMDDLSKPDKQVFYFRLDENCGAHEIRETDNMGEYLDVFFDRLMGE